MHMFSFNQILLSVQEAGRGKPGILTWNAANIYLHFSIDPLCLYEK